MIKVKDIFNDIESATAYIKSLERADGRIFMSRHNKNLANGNPDAIEVQLIMDKYKVSIFVIKHVLETKMPEFTNTCLVCGKPLDFIKKPWFHEKCTKKCSIELAKKKRKKTNLAKFGVENPWQSKEIQGKSKQTNLERYGCEIASNTPEAREKRRKTNLQKYGVESTFSSAEIRAKIKNTMLKKYGVENPSESEEIREKMKSTCIERYGVEYPIQNKQIKDKIVNTNITRRGVANVFSDPVVRDKAKETLIKRYNVDHNMKNPAVAEKSMRTRRINSRRKQYNSFEKILLSRNILLAISYEEHLTSDILKFKCLICGKVFQHTYNGCIVSHCNNIWCPDCHKRHTNGEDAIYKFLVDLLDKKEVLRNKRTIMANRQELDIYIPSKKVAIEFDGLYWHSSNICHTPKNYHVTKTEMCSNLGIKLIHIFENELEQKPNIVKSIIASSLGIYERIIYGRSCKVLELTDSQYKDFLETNHMQGYTPAVIKLGLTYKDELVACIGIGKSRFEKNTTELIRFCTKINTSVIGALSKLIKHSGVEELTSYVDRRYFNGSGYITAGFEFIGKTSPSYIYVNQQNHQLSRFQCQKHKLASVLGDKFDPSKSEVENMTLAGYYQLFDCGTLKFKYTRIKGDKNVKSS